MSLSRYEILTQFPFHNYTSEAVRQRGRTYFQQGRVKNIDWVSDTYAKCTVEGSGSDYEIIVEFDMQNEEVYFDCDCPYAREHFCKHMVAVIAQMKQELRTSTIWASQMDNEVIPRSESLNAKRRKRNWRFELENILSFASTNQNKRSINRFAIIYLFSLHEYPHSNFYSYEPCRISENKWEPLKQVLDKSPEEIHRFLEADTSWINTCQFLGPNYNDEGCLNLNHETNVLIRFLITSYRNSGSQSWLFSYLPLIHSLNIPCFLVQHSSQEVTRLQIHPHPIDFKINIAFNNNDLVLSPHIDQLLENNNESKIDILDYSTGTLRVEDNIFTLTNPESSFAVGKLPMVISEEDIPSFLLDYYETMIQNIPVTGDMITWQDIQEKPIPQLYLCDDADKKLGIILKFAYGDFIVDLQRDYPEYSIQLDQLNPWSPIRVHRDPAYEEELFQHLYSPDFQLKKATNDYPYGTLHLRAKTHPFEFLSHTIPQLTENGIEIYGEKSLKIGKINRSTPSMRVNVSSGIDWFDLQTIISFGDQEISLTEVRKAVKKGQKYIKLADGSIGEIPPSWLEKYKHFWNLAHETEDGYRVQNFHVSLIDTLLEETQEHTLPSDFEEKRKVLDSFTHIQETELPAGFVGKLRPYQKHGYDWLHFLHAYHFGGILADDMGLGKTIQVLAFLQSLYEQKPDLPASLLVVPKSLVTNWQREAATFTPQLRFYEYLGNTREKDTTLFDQYNVIITTYGTMQRDILTLKEHPFHTIILDESQAIKNPLTKNARAVRLLSANHRLSLTGTPVENSSFELWSQFAFLNPGLLGNLDSFKRDFANPIENNSDEEAANMLRRLVYPFILRRTKKQVAPELPPRTERVIYTDMEPAQKKLYQKTRTQYQKELSGLLDAQGMNSARFKILEGLLRLRQISIHPQLINKSFKGDAAKFERLFEILETLQAENHKALIFSQFTEALSLIKQTLEKQKIPYVYLDGKTRKRQEKVDQFQNDPNIPFFLISLKAGGTGLNLTAAEYVIHMDPWWNPAVEMQASDRAHRIGQENPVFVYKLITRDTVEEKVLLLQERKRALVDQLITNESGFFKSLKKEDIQDLFS